jgi:hypothetical protein
MPPVRCGEVTAAGRPCRAYATQGSDPPLCASHAGRTPGAGPPPNNRNAATHGFYSKVYLPTEIADLLRYTGDMTLDDEIACARVALRRVMELLTRAQRDPEHAGDSTKPGGMEIHDYAELAGLVLQATRTIGHLMRERRAVSGEAADSMVSALAQVIDGLATEWGVEL